MFTNIKVNDYIYATRFIASWVRAGGRFGLHGEGYADFRKWLESLGWVKKDEIDQIIFLAQNGKLELEYLAKEFIKNMKTK